MVIDFLVGLARRPKLKLHRPLLNLALQAHIDTTAEVWNLVRVTVDPASPPGT